MLGAVGGAYASDAVGGWVGVAGGHGHGGAAASGPSAWRHLVNVLKSFIGSNYLSIPFAFAASGLVLGPLAVFAIAAISGECNTHASAGEGGREWRVCEQPATAAQ